ncbi:hypothetical protein F8M41_022062 [Gigaspora margarita]|uniref:(d)CMP kinase n=1 Tax=Gigaspora margarita TaxID=4874 RepID=A0A8H4B1B7_GIGMA|nr:hypothetical protein F8M41_022062 [Gigaspora margarita]
MDQREIINQLFHLFLQFLITINSDQNQNYNYPIHSSNYNHISDNDDNSDYMSADKKLTNQYTNYIPITKFLRDNNIDPQQFYLKFNEIVLFNMVYEYEYPLNSGRCWNCNKFFYYRCCAACKRILKNCDCKFICSLTFPTGQKNKKNKYNQFKKCKWYTSDSDNLDHDCIRMISKDKKLVLFKDEKNFQRIFFAQSLKMNSNYKISIKTKIFQKEYNQLFGNWCLRRISNEILKQANEFLTIYKPFFGIYNIYYYNLETIETSLQLQQLLMINEMIGSPSYYLQEIEFHLQEKKSQEKLQIGQKASEIFKIPKIQNIINEIIQTITKNRRYVVVEHDATTKILPSARVKLVLEANFETQVYRRAKQLNTEEFEAIEKVFSDLLKCDVDSFDLVLEAKKVATIINTSDLSIEQVVQIKANSQVNSFDPQEESSTSQTKEFTV